MITVSPRRRRDERREVESPAFVLVVALMGAVFVDGVDDILHAVPTKAWVIGIFVAVLFPIVLIGGHSPKLGLILYGAWFAAVLAIGIATRDENIMATASDIEAAVWLFALICIFIVLPIRVVKRLRRRQPKPPAAPHHLPD